MVVGGGESVVAQYKRQAEQIESLRAEFEDSEGEKRKRLEEISNIEESWLPSLRCCCHAALPSVTRRRATGVACHTRQCHMLKLCRGQGGMVMKMRTILFYTP